MRKSNLLADSPAVVSREKLSRIWDGTSALRVGTGAEQARHCLGLVLTHIRREPFEFVLTVTSIIVSLLILCLFLIVAINAQQQVHDRSQGVRMSAYVKEGTSSDVVEQLKKESEKLPGIATIGIRSKSEALVFFKQLVGADSPLLAGLDDKNPLPVSLEITFQDSASQSENYERVKNSLTSSQHVEVVRVHNGDLSKISQALQNVRRFSLFATIFMILVSGLLISNAIRLTIYANREELEIMQLVGASRRYMQLPFLIEGTLEGLVGALVAVGISRLLFIWLNTMYLSSPLGELSGESLNFLNPGYILLVLVIGTVTGFGASFFATRSVAYETGR